MMKKVQQCKRCKNDYLKEELETVYLPKYVPGFGKPLGMKEFYLCNKCYAILNNWLQGEQK